MRVLKLRKEPLYIHSEHSYIYHIYISIEKIYLIHKNCFFLQFSGSKYQSNLNEIGKSEQKSNDGTKGGQKGDWSTGSHSANGIYIMIVIHINFKNNSENIIRFRCWKQTYNTRRSTDGRGVCETSVRKIIIFDVPFVHLTIICLLLINIYININIMNETPACVSERSTFCIVYFYRSVL